MAIKTIELKNIKSNPFNARTDYAEKPIGELAKEIEKSGFWAGALRGRMRDGKVELCFGHRRLAALKKLGYKDVPVDIVNLDDEEMAMQGLAENLQRQGLNDMEKAEGIKRLSEQLVRRGSTREEANRTIAEMLGVSSPWIRHLISITEYPEPVKKLIGDRKIAGRTAIEAQRFGGPEMVKTVAKEKIPLHTITKFSQSLAKIPDKKIKEQLRDKIAKGEITSVKEIEKRAEPMLRAQAEKNKPPPDLLIVIARWTDSIKDWRKALREVIPYRDYLDTSPKIAGQFRTEVQGLIDDLEKFL